jgi:hypothetical protein
MTAAIRPFPFMTSRRVKGQTYFYRHIRIHSCDANHLQPEYNIYLCLIKCAPKEKY